MSIEEDGSLGDSRIERVCGCLAILSMLKVRVYVRRHRKRDLITVKSIIEKRRLKLSAFTQ